MVCAVGDCEFKFAVVFPGRLCVSWQSGSACTPTCIGSTRIQLWHSHFHPLNYGDKASHFCSYPWYRAFTCDTTADGSNRAGWLADHFGSLQNERGLPHRTKKQSCYYHYNEAHSTSFHASLVTACKWVSCSWVNAGTGDNGLLLGQVITGYCWDR